MATTLQVLVGGRVGSVITLLASDGQEVIPVSFVMATNDNSAILNWIDAVIEEQMPSRFQGFTALLYIGGTNGVPNCWRRRRDSEWKLDRILKFPEK